MALRVALGTGCRRDIHVSPCAGDQVLVSRDGAAEVVEVGSGGNSDIGSQYTPTEVVEVLGGERHHLSSGNGAAIEEIACDIEVEVIADDQGPACLQITPLNMHVKLRYQGFGRCAIGQGDVFLDQPDDVIGQLGHLGGGKGCVPEIVKTVAGGSTDHRLSRQGRGEEESGQEEKVAHGRRCCALSRGAASMLGVPLQRCRVFSFKTDIWHRTACHHRSKVPPETNGCHADAKGKGETRPELALPF